MDYPILHEYKLLLSVYIVLLIKKKRYKENFCVMSFKFCLSQKGIRPTETLTMI